MGKASLKFKLTNNYKYLAIPSRDKAYQDKEKPYQSRAKPFLKVQLDK